MGIKNLHQFLKKYLKKVGKLKDVYREVSLRAFKGKRVAIDVSIYLYKYKCVRGDEWLGCFHTLITSLQKYGIDMVMVFDGAALPAKKVEHKKRKEQRVKLNEQIQSYESMFNTYMESGVLSKELLELYKKKTSDTFPLLLDGEEPLIDRKLLQDIIEQKKRQIVKITQQDIQTLKEMFALLHIPYVIAKYEAEALCGNLCCLKKVDAVLTEDTDILCYQTPIFMFKLNTYTGKCTVIYFDELLKALELTSKEFIDFCIMCGTDYNHNIPKIGPVNSFKLIQKHRNIDDISNETKHDTSILKHDMCRKIFENNNNEEGKNLTFNFETKKEVDKKMWEEFSLRNRIY